MVEEQRKEFRRYWIVASFMFAVAIYGMYLCDGQVDELLAGLTRIITSPSTLITDYVLLGGPSAAFVNAGMLGLSALGVCAVAGVGLTGPAIAAVFTVCGFGFFGKNLFNVWPIIFGVALHSRFKGLPFKDHLLIALFGTSLAPLVSELAFGGHLSPMGNGPFSLVMAVLGGLAVGFFLPPLAKHFLVVHQGYNLYNVGFSCGFLGLVALGTLRALGIPLEGGFYWFHGGHDLFFVPLLLFFSGMIITGFIICPDFRRGLAELYSSSGRLVSDFVQYAGFGPSLVNMGTLGLVGLLYLKLTGGDINGPTIGGLMTLSGFGGFGKHLRNVLPVALGTWFAGAISVWPVNNPGATLAVLFSGCLAPVGGAFGPAAGFAAGFLHLIVVMTVGGIHGGLSLYNNGLSGGIVAAMLLPVLESLREED
jgi:hypothetical protein